MPAEEIMEFRVRNLEAHHAEFREAIDSIDKSLQTLTQLEAHHADTREALERAFKAIEDNRKDYEESCDKVDVRLRHIELQMPILKMTSRWIIGGTIGVVTAVFSSVGLFLYAVFHFISGAI